MKKHLLQIILICFLSLGISKAQKIILLTRSDVASGINYAGLDDGLYNDLVSKGYQVTKYYPAGLTAGSATDWTLLNGADLIIVGRNVASANFSGVDVANWTNAKVPVIYLSGYVMRSGNLKMVNLNSVSRLASNGSTISNTLVTNANVLDANDPAFSNITVNNGEIDYFKWFYDYMNVDETAFATGNNGKLLASISADPLYPTTEKKILMARWKPGVETYTGSTVFPITYRAYIQIGADDGQSGTAKLFNYNQYTSTSFQVICNEINYLISINQIVTFSNVSDSKFNISWKNSSNTSQVVFVSAATTGTPTLTNNMTYTASSVFGQGTDAGGGWYCVYNGTGNSAAISGLTGNTSYRVMVCDYNGTTGSEVYQTVVLPGNPVNQLTLMPKQSQTITFNTLSAKMIGDGDFDPVATASSGLPVSYSSSDLNVAAIINGMIHIMNVGTCNITASQAGDANYNPAQDVQQTLVINGIAKQSQTISFSSLPEKTIGDNDFDPGANASSGLPISYSSSDLNVATIVNGKVHIIGAGTCNIVASQSGDVTFNPAPDFPQTFIVNKASQTITFGTMTANYGDAPLALNAVATSGLPITYSSSNSKIASVSGSALTVASVGTCNITATQTGDANYSSASITQSITISKALLSVNVNDVTRVKGQANPVFTITYSGFKFTDNVDSISVKPTIDCNANAYSPVGNYDITPSGASDNNYDFLYVKGTLTVISVTTVESGKSKEVSVYPNPVTDKLIISLANNSNKGVIEVYSVAGTLLSRVTVNSNTMELDFSNYIPATYIIRIITNENTMVKQVIKQ